MIKINKNDSIKYTRMGVAVAFKTLCYVMLIAMCFVFLVLLRRLYYCSCVSLSLCVYDSDLAEIISGFNECRRLSYSAKL